MEFSNLNVAVLLIPIHEYMISNIDFYHHSIFIWFVAPAASSDGKKIEIKEDGLPIEVKLPIKHVLSKELQVRIYVSSWIFSTLLVQD